MKPKLKLKSDPLTAIARKKLPKDHLPSELVIIAFFRFHHENNKESTGKSVQIVASAVVDTWNHAGLPHQLNGNVARLVTAIFFLQSLLKEPTST